MTAFAEVGQPIKSLDEITNDKCFTIKVADQNPNTNRGTWLYSADDASHLWSTTIKNVTVSNEDDNQKFAFIQSPSDPSKYFIYSVVGKKFLAYDPTLDETGATTVALVDQIADEASVATFLNSTHSDKANYPWVVALGDKDGGSHQIGLSPGYHYGVITSYNDLGDGGNSLTLIDAGTFDPKDALEEINTFINTAKVKEANKYLSVPADAVGSAGGYDAALWNALNNICGGDKVADATDAAKPGFDEALRNLKEAPLVSFSSDKVYIIKHPYTNSVLCAKEGDNKIYRNSIDASTIVENSDKWQVYQDVDGNYYLYNQGTKGYAKFESPNWVFTETPYGVTIGAAGTASVSKYGPCLSIADGQSNMFNAGGIGSDNMTTWGTLGANDGSCFYFVETEGTAVDFGVLIAKEQAEQIIEDYDAEHADYVGAYSTEGIEHLEDLLQKTDVTSEELNEAMSEAVVKVQDGKYYFLLNTMNFNDGGVKAIYANPDGKNVAWHTTEGTAAELWQFVQEDGGDGDYYIKNVNSGKSIVLPPGAFSGSLQETSSTPFRFSKQGDDLITFGLQAWDNQNSDKATLVIKTSDADFNAYAKSSDQSGNYIGAYNDFGAAVPSKWNIVEASSVNLTIGSTGYATAYFPFAVTIPEGVKAYTVSAAADGKATLSPLTGTIPANTGVILSGDAKTYPFAITTSTGSKVEGNMLDGVTMATDLNPETSYILADGTNGLGFYKVDSNDKKLAANKAYLVVSNAADASYSLKLDGAVTGIQSVENAAENAPAYDLQGRRLPQVPTKGLYIQNGKKIMK